MLFLVQPRHSRPPPPSQVPSMLSTSLNAEGLQFLQGYFQVANVQLV